MRLVRETDFSTSLFKLEEEGLEAGKQITIYAYRQPSLDWHVIFQRIVNSLIDNNIAPSCCPYGNNPLKNNPYISYRNDASFDDTYQHNAGHYNPYHNHMDPFQSIENFSISREVRVPTWDAVVGRTMPTAVSLEFLQSTVSMSSTSSDPFNLNNFMKRETLEVLGREHLGASMTSTSTTQSCSGTIGSEDVVSVSDPMLAVAAGFKVESEEDRRSNKEEPSRGCLDKGCNIT